MAWILDGRCGTPLPEWDSAIGRTALATESRVGQAGCTSGHAEQTISAARTMIDLRASGPPVVVRAALPLVTRAVDVVTTVRPALAQLEGGESQLPAAGVVSQPGRGAGARAAPDVA
jgi:hypothetical protein